MNAQNTKDQAPKINLFIWKKLAKRAMKFKWDFAGIIFFMGLTAVTNVLMPMMTKQAIDRFIVPCQLDGLLRYIIQYGTLSAVQVSSVFLFIYFGGKVEAGICHMLRKDGFSHLQQLPFSYYDRTAVGLIMSPMTSDVGHLGEAFAWILVDIVWAVVYLLAAIITMFIIDTRMTLFVLLIVPPLTAVSVYFQRKILEKQRQVRKANAKIISAFNEGIMGAKTSKTLVIEDDNIAAFHNLSSDIRQKSIRSAMLSSIYLPLVIAISSVATAFVLSDGTRFVLNGIVTLGTLTAFVNYTLEMFDPIHNIAATIAEMQRMQAAAERVINLLETEADITDAPEVIAAYGDTFHPKKENWEPLSGDIRFDHVSFRYQNGEEVLKDFSLHIKQGQTVALVGQTGAGKSTIVNLLCRFYEPTDGTIYIDGIDYKKRSQLWLQSNLGYVLQDPHLFTGTIMDNIKYAKPDATDEEAMEAARLVHADSFIQKLELGYQTPVGEAGSRLSTGEKQLISFARAILNRPRLFVLDEATSSIDTETEQLIQDAIQTVLAGRTSFMIAHRLSTIRNADLILVISGGRIAEQGTHDELMQKKGAYYQLYTTQYQEEQSLDILTALPASKG